MEPSLETIRGASMRASTEASEGVSMGASIESIMKCHYKLKDSEHADIKRAKDVKIK